MYSAFVRVRVYVCVNRLGRDAWNGWVIWLRCVTIGFLKFVCLHGYLKHIYVFHGPKKKWRDVLKDDLTALGIKDSC